MFHKYCNHTIMEYYKCSQTLPRYTPSLNQMGVRRPVYGVGYLVVEVVKSSIVEDNTLNNTVML